MKAYGSITIDVKECAHNGFKFRSDVYGCLQCFYFEKVSRVCMGKPCPHASQESMRKLSLVRIVYANLGMMCVDVCVVSTLRK